MTSRLLGSPWSVAARSIAYWSLPRNHKRIQLNAPYRKIPRYGGEVTIAPTDRTLRQVRSPSSFTASPCTTATRGPTGSALDLRSQATRSRSLARKSIAGWQRPLRSTKRRTYSGDMLKVLGMSTERYAVLPSCRCFPCMMPRIQPLRKTSSGMSSARARRR